MTGHPAVLIIPLAFNVIVLLRPFTSKRAVGLVKPMPTLPLVEINIPLVNHIMQLTIIEMKADINSIFIELTLILYKELIHFV